MNKKVIFPIFALIILITNLSAQGFQPPTPGKAVIYFTRVSSYGYAVSFEFFHNDKYIGAFKGKNYMRYECDTGKQLLWASSENREFIDADLKNGETYIVIVDVKMGAWKAQVGLTPLSIANQELFDRAKKLILSEPPVVISLETINKLNKKLEEFIPEQLIRYENEWKNTNKCKYITSDMAIPAEVMK